MDLQSSAKIKFEVIRNCFDYFNRESENIIMAAMSKYSGILSPA